MDSIAMSNISPPSAWPPVRRLFNALFLGTIAAIVERKAPAESPPTFRWAEVVSGGRARLTALAMDNAHNSYVLGDVIHTDTPGDGIPFTVRGAFLVKYDASGKLVWLTQGTDNAATGSSIAADASGHVFVAYELSGATMVANRLYDQRLLLIGYDARGRVNSITPASSREASQSAAIATDQAGNCYWVYSLKESSSADKPTSSVVLEKFDAAGQPLWSRILQGSSSGVRLAVDGSGCAVVAGSFKERLQLGTTHVVTNDLARSKVGQIYLAKLNAAGEVLRVTKGDCSWINSVYSLGTDAAGNATLLGGFSEKITFGSITLNGGDRETVRDFVVRYTPDATVLWAHTLPGCATDGRCMVAGDAGNNSYLARMCSSRELTFSKFDAAGRVLWSRPGPKVGVFQFAADNAGYCVLGAMFTSITADFDNTILRNGGDPSRFPGIVLGMLDTTCPPWQNLNPTSNKPKGKPVFYMGPAEGFKVNARGKSPGAPTSTEGTNLSVHGRQ
jgi:hypothetical protein